MGQMTQPTVLVPATTHNRQKTIYIDTKIYTKQNSLQYDEQSSPSYENTHRNISQNRNQRVQLHFQKLLKSVWIVFTI